MSKKDEPDGIVHGLTGVGMLILVLFCAHSSTEEGQKETLFLAMLGLIITPIIVLFTSRKQEHSCLGAVICFICIIFLILLLACSGIGSPVQPVSFLNAASLLEAAFSRKILTFTV